MSDQFKLQSIRDRIRELRRVPASQLKPYASNPKEHPSLQRLALRAVLAEIGVAQALVARETPNGLELLDGHLRAEEAGDTPVPVVIVDLNDEEAQKLVATMDHVGRFAEWRSDVLMDLLSQIEAEDRCFRELVEQLLHEAETQLNRESTPAAPSKRTVDRMELYPHEHWDYILVLARTVREWNRLCEILGLDPRMPKTKKLGRGRGIPAKRLLEILEGKTDEQGRTPGSGDSVQETATQLPAP